MTRAEAEQMLWDAVNTGRHYERIIAALTAAPEHFCARGAGRPCPTCDPGVFTAPPEKPKVDVRKVWKSMWVNPDDMGTYLTITKKKLADALRADGVETVE